MGCGSIVRECALFFNNKMYFVANETEQSSISIQYIYPVSKIQKFQSKFDGMFFEQNEKYLAKEKAKELLVPKIPFHLACLVSKWKLQAVCCYSNFEYCSNSNILKSEHV